MSFTWPYVLVALLLVPAVIVLAWWLDRRRARYAVAFTNLELLAAVAGTRRPWRRLVPLILFVLALAAAVTTTFLPVTTKLACT